MLSFSSKSPQKTANLPIPVRTWEVGKREELLASPSPVVYFAFTTA